MQVGPALTDTDAHTLRGGHQVRTTSNPAFRNLPAGQGGGYASFDRQAGMMGGTAAYADQAGVSYGRDDPISNVSDPIQEDTTRRSSRSPAGAID